MRVIGLTGGIASGKSTVSQHLSARKFPIIDCDKISHAVVAKGRWGWKRVLKEFGNVVLGPEGELNREELGRIIFNDPEQRRKLNKATHLPIALEILKQILWQWTILSPVVIVDMPLLFETHSHQWMHRTVLVMVDADMQVERLMARDGLSRDDAVARIRAQMSLDSKCAMADDVVDNSGSLQGTRDQVDSLIKALNSGTKWRGIIFSPVGFGTIAVSLTFLARRLLLTSPIPIGS